VLTIYLQLAKVVVGLVPPSQEDVSALMKQCDTDGDGVVDLEEFDALVAVLLSNIVGRVVMQALFQLLFIPAVAAWLVQLLTESAPVSVVEKLTYLPPGLLATVVAILLGLVIITPLLQAVDNYIRKLSIFSQKKTKIS